MAARSDKTIKLETLFRTAEIVRGADGKVAGLDKEKRTVRVQFSSEAEVKRWFGTEILDHSPESVDLSRVQAGAAVLCEHDTAQRCGITESGNITNSRTGEAVVRFARTPLGDQVMNEVEDGTLRWLSVGYRVEKFEVDEDEEEYRAIRWTPLEVSFVAIPADPSARVLRSNQKETEAEIMMTRSRQHDADPGQGTGGGPTIAPSKEDFSKLCDEVREISALSLHWQRTHPGVADMAQKAIKDKVGLEKFQRDLLEHVSTNTAREDVPSAQEQAQRGAKSIGARFTEDKNYRAAIGARKFKGISVEVPDEYQFRTVGGGMLTRATFNAGTEGIAGSSGVNIDQRPEFNMLGQQPLFVADLFAQGATTGDQIRIVREESYTQAATRVAEGGNKPEASLELVVANFTVEKSAVFLNVTEEMLSDFAQAASFVNQRLSYMVQSLEDTQLLSGSGSSQIRGILNTTGIQTLSGATGIIDNLLKAKAYVEGANGAGFAMPDAYVMHPLDWLTVRLSKDSNGQYLFGGPGYAPYGVGQYSNVGMMWGLPVVSTTSISQGTALTGAFRMGAQIFRRMGLTMRTTDSHASNFIANILTIVAEQRMGFPVYMPNKFCAITDIPAPA